MISVSRSRFWFLVGVLLAGHAVAQQSAAIAEAPPNCISYQGTLFHANDPGVAYDGALTLQFRLYKSEAASLDEAVWAEQHAGTQVFGGIFNVYLGAGDAIDGAVHEPLQQVFTGGDLWLGIKVGLDDEIVPRSRIRSIPYAMTAATVNTATHGVPAGTVMMFAGATVPEGWLVCDGSEHLKESYPSLYQAVGGVWGETTTTFQVPDLRARVPVGNGVGLDANTDTRSGTTAKLHFRPMGSTAGTESQPLAVQEMPPHRHAYNDKSGSGSTSIVAFWWDAADENQFNDNPFTTAAAGGGAAHNNLQPVAYMHYIIKY